jgi:hypothetical protein
MLSVMLLLVDPWRGHNIYIALCLSNARTTIISMDPLPISPNGMAGNLAWSVCPIAYVIAAAIGTYFSVGNTRNF